MSRTISTPRERASFHHPTIGPKNYTARGSSGWTEVFPRVEADKALKAFLGAVTVEIAVSGFRSRQSLQQKRLIDWSSILEFLADICKADSNLVTDQVGVAFWCHILLAITNSHEGVN